MPKNVDKVLREIKIPESGSINWSAPIVSGNKLVFGACDKHLYCLDKNTGKLIWKFLTGGAIPHPANVIKDKIYFSSLDKYHYCVSLKSGELIWKRLFPKWPAAPTFVDGVLYLGCTDNNLYALSADDGKILWNFRTGGLIVGAPTIINNSIHFGSFDKNFYCLELDGKLKWKFITGGAISQAFSISSKGEQTWKLLDRNENRTVEDGMIYLGSWDNYLYALSLDGKFIWRFLTGNIVPCSPVIYNNAVYFGSWDRNFYSLNAENGAMNWRFVTGGPLDTHALLLENTAYFGSCDHNLYALNLDGKQVWTFTTGGIVLCPPVIADGVLYFGSIDTFLYAIKLKDRKILWRFQTGMPAGTYEQFFKDWVGIVETEKKPFTFAVWRPETLKTSYDWSIEVGKLVTSPYKSENPYTNKPIYRMENPYEMQKKKKEPWER